MRYLNKIKKIKTLLILCISVLLFSSLGSIYTFYKFTDIESTLSSNVGNDGIFTYTENGLKYFAEFITEEKVELMKKQIKITDSSKESDQIINGMGTGAESLTEEALERTVGQIMILDVIKDPKNPIDSKASYDLSSEIYFPPVRSQGSQGSCTSWASVYYSMGYLEAKDNGWDASSGNNTYLLSPAWSYNKLTDEGSGTHHIETGLLLEEWGAATWETIPYTDTDYTNWGNESAWRDAPLHRPLQFNWLSYSGNPTINTIKNLVEGGTPVTFNIDADEYNPGLVDNYILSSAEYSSSIINHAQCIVGFDDSITEGGDVGAFRVVNSWGDIWGDSGFYWLTYETLKEIGVLGDGSIQIGYYDDRIDYHPSLVATWEFSSAPTRMGDIITLGVGPHDAPLDTITPHYENDENNLFPEFMALDISEFQSYYDSNNDVLFYLELGSSNTPGIISSFRIERFISGVLQEITLESPDVLCATPGYVIGTFMYLNHEIKVDLEVPTNPEIYQTYIINATVTNTGINIETNVDLFLYLESVLVNSTTVSTLPVGARDTINYVWTPVEYKNYNFTVYAPPVPDEIYIENNIATELITTSLLQNYTMMQNYEYSWIDASGGTELFLGDDSYSIQSLPFNFQFYDKIFSTIYLGANGYLSFTDSTPREWSNDQIPSGEIDNYYLIAPFWDDLLTGFDGGGGTIYVQSFGTYCVAEWQNIKHVDGYLIGSFEVILYESGEIVFNYDYIDYVAGGYTCGLNLGVNTSYYNSYQGLTHLTDDFALRFSIDLPPSDFILSSNAGTPDEDGNFDLSWTSADRAQNYSVYEYSSYITEINESLSLLEDDITDLSLALSDYTDGTYYFIIVAHNAYGDTLSNCIEVVVGFPPGDFILSSSAGTPDDNGVFDLHWTSSAGAQNYSVYEYSRYITEVNGSLTFLEDDITDLSLALSEYTDGTYYFIIVAHNAYGDTLSNCIEIVVQIPPWPGNFVLSSNAGTPDDNGAFDLSWTTAARAQNYSVYEYSSYITEINESLSLLEDDTTDLSLALSDYTDGTYYFIAVAHNAYGDTLSNCIEVIVGITPSDFILSSNAGTPDDNGAFDLSWTSAVGAQNYSVYEYSSYITEINGSLNILGDGIIALSTALSGYTNGTYFFIVVAHNAYGDTLSNCIEVVVKIPEPKPTQPIIPGYNLFVVISIICVVSIILLKNRYKFNNN